MQLCLSDPSYTDRLASFLGSLGQTVRVAVPGRLELDLAPTPSGLREVEIYLGVWAVLYPDADIHVAGDDGEAGAPAA